MAMMSDGILKRKSNMRIKRKFLDDDKLEEEVKRTKLELLTDVKSSKNILSRSSRSSAVEFLLKLHLLLEHDLHKDIFEQITVFSKEYLPRITKQQDKIISLLFEAVCLTVDINAQKELLGIILKILPHVDSSKAQDFIQFFINEKDGRLILNDRLDPLPINLITHAMTRGILNSSNLNSNVFICANRSIKASSCTQTRIGSINFYVSSYITGCDKSSFSNLENILCDMVSDRDARVRLTAVNGLAELCHKTDQVTLMTYTAMAKMVTGNDRYSRVAALKLLLSFANKSPNREIPMTFNPKDNIMLSDDAFSIICHAINDQEVLVRTEAAKLLGQFTTVSDSFLDQTLDKKLMRTMQTVKGTVVRRETTSLFAITKQIPKRIPDNTRWKSWQQAREKKSTYAGDWASGKDLNAPCPLGEANKVEDESIIPQGACGAFVSALEDEYMSVRKAAVYSLGKLAAHRPSFATSALDHLADMFNDEIASVRLDAIHALTPLVVHGQLQKEQLEVILKCLDDAMGESRQALRDLLCKAEFADIECMKIVVKALLNCLQRFPVDREKIFKCMTQIGLHHGVFVHSMLSELLDLHPTFEPQEQPIEDVYYSAKLILVLNASSKHDPLVSLLPFYVLKHYRFMRAARPDLVCLVPMIDKKLLLCSRMSYLESDEKNNNVEVLIKTYERLRDVHKEHLFYDRNVLRSFISDDLAAISSFNAPLSGAANFLVNICELLSSLESIQQTVVCVGSLSDVVTLLEEEQVRVKCLHHQFSNLNPSIINLLIEINLHLDILMIIIRLIKNPEDFISIVDDLLEVLSVNQKRWSEAGIVPTKTAESLINNIQDKIVQNEDNKSVLSTGFLARLIQLYSIEMPDSFEGIDKVQCKWAKIIEPEKEYAAENSIRFVAGLPIALSLSAEMHNLTQSDISELRIQVDYPDQSRTFHRPRVNDFSGTGTRTLLSTKVLLTTNTTWAESALATLTIVMLSGECSNNTPVPLCQTASSQETCQIQVRLHPMHRT